jgi:hypothetical protein
VLHISITEPLCEIAGDVAWPVIGQQPGSVRDVCSGLPKSI